MPSSDGHDVPWWIWPLVFCVGILALASIDDQPNNEPFMNVCNRPIPQQTC
jgi:hypothetical protein